MKTIRSVLVMLSLLGTALAAESVALPELQGILVIGSEQRFALVAPGGEHSGWIALGGTFEGWSLVSYDAKQHAVTLQRGDRRVAVPLRAEAVTNGSVTPATRVTVAEANAMLDRMKFEAMWDRIVAEQKKAMVGALRQQTAGEFARDGLSETEIDSLLGKMSDAVVGGMKSDAMRKDFAQIFSDVYTKDELQGMADFYDTSAGRAWVQKQPEVQEKMMQLLMPRVMQGMPAAQQIAADYLQHRQATAHP